ncbi:MAG: LPP20 family lipoprotein [Planctomycetes bacterium]|nr:LPP20 family lipoprotein [Planctomycetota bacterium]
MHIRNATSIALTFVIAVAAAPAQDVIEAQNKLLSKRAAEADAYRKLAEAVYGLQLNSRTYVKDYVTESDEIHGQVDEFIKGIRLGDPVWYDDGSCEVPAEVTVAKVIEILRSTHDRHYRGDSVKTEDFESITRRTEKKVIKVIGMGAPREELPLDLPEGVAEMLGPPPTTPGSGPPPIPDIWMKVGPQARLMAIGGARKDAQRKLAERIKGLRLTARTQVRDFMTESDLITTELSAHLVGAYEVGTYLHHDELIAEVTMRVPTEQVITAIKELHSRHYKGDDVKGHDIEKIVKTAVKRDFEATGMSVPPPQFIERYEQRAQVDLPDWSMDMIAAEGMGTDEAIGTAQGRLKAARAAELDARRKLAERIAGLSINAETSVRDFATQHDHISSLVDAIMVDAVVTNTRFTSDTAIVTVQVPGMCVWGVVNDELVRQQRRP